MLTFVLSNFTALAAGGGESKEFNPSETIMHHIADSHEWHFATIGHTHITIPLPVILYSSRGVDVFLSSELHHAAQVEHTNKEGKKEKFHKIVKGNNTYLADHHGHFHLESGEKLYDLSITKNVASLLLSATLMLIFFFSVAAGYKKNRGKAPRGIQSFFEPLIVFVRDDIAKVNIGDKYYQKFVPYLLTLFFFILINNLLGLLPGGANLTGNIAVTLTLAVLTFLITIFSAKKTYWMHIIAPPVPPALLVLMIPIEIIGIFTKPFSLMIRLFANITAGHIIILSLFSLIFVFQSLLVSPVVVAFAVFMNVLELLVAFLQAYVFTLLTAMYIGGAVEEHDHHDEHHAHGDAAHH
jgi:F-type H+-transporting ATPase subunit a